MLVVLLKVCTNTSWNKTACWVPRLNWFMALQYLNQSSWKGHTWMTCLFVTRRAWTTPFPLMVHLCRHRYLQMILTWCRLGRQKWDMNGLGLTEHCIKVFVHNAILKLGVQKSMGCWVWSVPLLRLVVKSGCWYLRWLKKAKLQRAFCNVQWAMFVFAFNIAVNFTPCNIIFTSGWIQYRKGFLFLYLLLYLMSCDPWHYISLFVHGRCDDNLAGNW